MVKFIIGILAGLVWGALAALANGGIAKACVKKNGKGAAGASNILSTLVSLVFFAAVVLLRNVLPFRYEGMLVGTAISMSMLGIVIAFNMARK